MPIDLTHFKEKSYPTFQTTGNAARFIMPFATEVCMGKGVDVGCGKFEWQLPGSIPVDPVMGDYNSHNFPYTGLDYVFSSHCLEHLPGWVTALDYWHDALKPCGVLFLYLPDFSQEYWRPWNNRKHVNVLTPEVITAWMRDKGMDNIFVSGVDLNNSFAVMAEKRWR